MPAYSISCKAALAGRVSNAIRSIETARVHHATRRRGDGVAARGVGARDHGRGRLSWQYFFSHSSRLKTLISVKGFHRAELVAPRPCWLDGIKTAVPGHLCAS